MAFCLTSYLLASARRGCGVTQWLLIITNAAGYKWCSGTIVLYVYLFVSIVKKSVSARAKNVVLLGQQLRRAVELDRTFANRAVEDLEFREYAGSKTFLEALR